MRRWSRKSVLMFAAALLMISSPGYALTEKTLDEILTLPPKDFTFAVSEYTRNAVARNDPAAIPGLWKLFDKAIETRQPEKYPIELSYVTEAIGILGSDADLQKLLPYYDAERNDNVRLHTFLVPLSNIFIRQELKSVLMDIKQKPLPLFDEKKLPPSLQNASADLQKAWMTYQAVRSSFCNRFESGPWHETSPDEQTIDDIYNTIGSLLHGNGSVTEKLSGYQWTSWRITNSNTIYLLRYLGLFMSLLKDRKYQDALGALMSFEMMGRHHPQVEVAKVELNWKRRYITFCGYDWETLYAGMENWNYLAAFGSDRSANYIADYLEHPTLDRHEKVRYAYRAAEFIDKGPAAVEDRSIHYCWGTVPRVAGPVSASIQHRLLKLITKQVTPDMDKQMADESVSALAMLYRPETRDALQIIMKLPYENASMRAARILKAMGENVGIPPKSQPVRFLLLDHGSPLTGLGVEVEFSYDPPDSRRSFTRKTLGADSIVEFDRDLFADRQISSIAFRTARRVFDSDSHPEDPVFYIRQSVPEDLNTQNTVNLDFAKMTVKFEMLNVGDFKWFFRFNSPGQDPKAFAYKDGPVRAQDIPASGEMVFPKVGRGSYIIELVSKRGFIPVVSKTIEMTGQDQTVILTPPAVVSSQPTQECRVNK